MVPLQDFATTVLGDLIRKQPPSTERTAFAWQVAVGPALARSTTVTLRNGVLTVRSQDPRWATEIVRASDVILGRLEHLLGEGTVLSLQIAGRDTV